MISLEECKRILEDNKEYYSDEEIEKIRELLYKKSEIVINKLNIEECQKKNIEPLSNMCELVPQDKKN